MESKTIGYMPEKRFPTKASMNPKFTMPEAAAVSNHFKVLLESGSLSFIEWHISFINKSELAKYKSDPLSVQATAIPPDSRFLIAEVLRANRKDMFTKLGKNFATGVTLFSVRNVQFNNAFFDAHQKFVAIVEKKNNVSTLDSLVGHSESRMPLLRFLNSSIKNIFSQMGFIELGQNKKFYDPKRTEKVETGGHKFVVMKGYKTAFEIYEGGLKLMIDYSTRIVREYSLWEEVLFYRNQNYSDLSIIENFIKGRSVLTIYGSQRIYRVDDVLQNGRINNPFPNPEFKDYADYFAKRYKVTLRNKDQFLLVHHKKIIDRDAKGNETNVRIEKIILIPELVRATGLTDEMRSDFRIMKDIGVHTILPPSQRMDRIVNIADAINKSKNEGFNLNIQTNSNTVPSLRMPAPKILYGGQASEVPKGDRLNVNSLAETKDLNNWVFVYEPFCEKNIDVVIDNFFKSCSRYKIKLQEPGEYIPLDRKHRAEDIFNIIKKSKKTPSPDLIFFFIGKKNANNVYKEMKRFFNSNGIATQFFVSFNPNKDVSGLSKYGNLLLQMVNKIGGNLWYVDRTIKNSLLLGADVYHAKGSKSVASVVGQFDTYFKRSFSTATIQSKEYQEIMKSVSGMVIEQVENYVKANKQPPQHVIFFRDGVGEGQLQEVINVEVKAIEEKLAQKYQSQKPGLIFIVVTKRVDDRFAINSQGIKNPEAGLVVIKDVVKSDRANFFMIAQKVTQGTANPTHYDILYNNTSLSLNEIVSLTYELAWGYSNWLGPVKVPAPVQYAHKLCSLIGVTQDSNVNQQLKGRRFYM